MIDPRFMSEDEFEALFDEAAALLNGPHPEQAVQMFDDLIVRACEDVAVDDELTIDLRMHMGSALWRSGLAERAVPILQAALADAERTLGKDHRLTFACAGNLCRALGRAERFEEAFKIAIPLYKHRVDVFGEMDNGTLNSLGHMSQLLYEAGDFPHAIELMSELYEKRCDAFGKNDERSLQSAYNLTVMKAKFTNDEQSLLDLLAEYTATYGCEHPHTVTVWAHLAGLFERTGQLEEAREVWREVEQRRHEIFGEVAIPTLNAVGRRLQVEHELGYEEAAEHMSVVRRIVSRITGTASEWPSPSL